MLYIRSTFVPAILLILLTPAVSAVLFGINLSNEISVIGTQSTEVNGLETVFGNTAVPWVFAVSLVLLTVLLCIPGASFGSRTSYTMARLRVSEKSAFLCQAGYNTLMYCMFWCIGAVVLYAMCAWYEASVTTSTTQTVLLALYREEFLHSMLPLNDISRMIRNFSFCLGLGVSAAYYPFKQRSGKVSYVIVPMLCFVLGAFRAQMFQLAWDIWSIVISLFIAGLLIFLVLTNGMSFLFEED